MGGRGTASGLSTNAPRDSAAAWAATFGEADTSTARDARRAAAPEKTFSHDPIGTHKYVNPGDEDRVADVVDWFKEHSNYSELLDARSAADRDADREWMSGHFMNGQQYRGFSRMSRYDQDRTRSYDRMLDKATLDAPVQVVRLATPELLFGGGATGKPTAAQLRALEGRTVISKGNMSCSAANRGLTIDWSDNPGRVGKYIEYKFHIPGGTKGAGMFIGDTRFGSWGPRQLEFMMNRDTAWRVGKARYDSGRGCYVVDMEWAGRTAHDYS